MGKLMSAVQMAGLTVKKYSPELLVAAGGVGTVAAIFFACKATTKASYILEEHKHSIDEIKEVRNAEEFDEEYDDRDYKHDLAIVYSQTIIKFVKLYGPTILTATGALFCMFAAVNILRKRNAALAATCTTLMGAFADYRSRVKKRFGEEVEYDIYNGLEEIEEEVVKIDKNGNEKVKKQKKTVPGGSKTPFGFCFDSTNPNWTGDRAYDMCFIRSQERFANDRLIAKRVLPLNIVREELGGEMGPDNERIIWTEEGQVMGWAYIKDNPVGDNYVDFGIREDSKNYTDFMEGKTDFIMLNFNCDGNILTHFPVRGRVRKRNHK